MQQNELFKPLFAALIFFLLSLLFFGFYQLGDDTYIYLQYAKNIASGNGISFNAGEPSYGFTSPLWLGLIVALNMTVKDITQSPRILSLLFSMASIYVWYYILKRYFKKVPFLLLLLIAVEPNLLKHSNLGMEASLSFFLSSLFILQFKLTESRDIWRNFRLAGVAGVFFLVRPESILLLIAAECYLYLKKQSTSKEVAIAFGLFIVIVMPWHLFAYSYFGSILPTTFFAKGGTMVPGTNWYMHLVDSIRIFAGNYVSYLLIALVALLIKPGLKRDAENNTADILKPEMYTGFFVLLPLLFALFYMLFVNREYVYARYYCIAFPFLLLGAITILHSFNGVGKWMLFLSAVVVVQFMATNVYASNLTRDTFVMGERVEDEIINWVVQNTAIDSRIVRGRIGKIGFMTDRKIIDPQGIINPAIIPFVKAKTSPDYFATIRPEYFIGDSPGLSYVNEGKGTAQQMIIFTFNNTQLRDNRAEKKEKISVYKLFWK